MNRITTIGLVVVILSLIASLYANKVLVEKLSDERFQKEEILKAYNTVSAEVKIFKNANGALVAKNEALTIDRANLKKMVDGGFMPGLKELPGLKKNLRNLEHAYEIALKVNDSLKVKLRDSARVVVKKNGDTIRFVSKCDFYRKTKWFELSVLQESDTVANVNLETLVPVTGGVLWERKWFLGKKKFVAELTTENPHATVTALKNITVSKRR